jgi:hypothetical protein
MGNVLAYTFQGEHRWIRPDKRGKTIIDAMFFAANSEKVNDSDPALNYKK